MDLVQHLDALDTLLDRERAAEKERFARLPLVDRIRKGLALSDVEAVEEGGLAGRSLVTFARPGGRELGGQELGAGAIVRVLPKREAPPHDAPSGIVARRQRSRVSIAFDEPLPDWATEGRVILELQPSSATWERLPGAGRGGGRATQAGGTRCCAASRRGSRLARVKGRRSRGLPGDGRRPKAGASG